MVGMSKYCHDRGIKFGIYSDEGSKTCGGYPGSKGHEATDAATLARWGVDYLKLDGAFSPTVQTACSALFDP